MVVKLTKVIVFICLTNSSWPFDVKQDMLEATKNIALKGKCYNWVAHVTELIKSNCQR